MADVLHGTVPARLVFDLRPNDARRPVAFGLGRAVG
jgi:hypothetical protein